MKMARIVLVLSITPTGMIFTALTASVSSVNAPLTVSIFYVSNLFEFWIVCVELGGCLQSIQLLISSYIFLSIFTCFHTQFEALCPIYFYLI